MDKASDFGSEDCRFESCHGRLNFFCLFVLFLATLVRVVCVLHAIIAGSRGDFYEINTTQSTQYALRLSSPDVVGYRHDFRPAGPTCSTQPRYQMPRA